MGIKDIRRRPSASSGRPSAAWMQRSEKKPSTPQQQVAKGQAGEWAKDTSLIVDDARAQQSLGMAQGQAASLLTSAPPGTLAEYEERQLREVEEKGFVEQGLSGLLGALEFIDRPRALINLAIQDVTGQSEKSFGIDAYIDTVLGKRERLVEKYGAESVGERGDFSTSNLLNNLGLWQQDDDDSWGEKAARGLASFVGDVVLDPLTYVTFGASAVGGKGVITATRAAIDAAGERALTRAVKGVASDTAETLMERTMRENIVKRSEAVMDRLLREQADDAVELGAKAGPIVPEEVLRKQALEEAAGRRFKDLNPDSPTFGQMIVAEGGFNGGVVGDKVNEVVEVVANRNFRTLRDQHSDYIDHVFSRNAEGDRLGAAYTTGGMRIGNPFNPNTATRPLRFTQGAFEKWRGLRLLHKLPQSTVGKKVAKVTPFVDAEAPFIQVARQQFKDDSPLRGMTFTQLSYIEKQQIKAGAAIRRAANDMAAYNSAVRLTRAAKDQGLDDEATKTLYHRLYAALSTGDTAPLVNSGEYTPEVVAAFEETVGHIRDTLTGSYDVLRRLVPGMGEIENYVPIVFSSDFIKAVREIGERGAGFTGDDLEAAARRLSQQLDGEEISVEEMTLFMEAYESMVAAPVGKSAVGSTSALNRRQIGRYLKSMDDTSQSAVLFDVQPVDGRAFVDQQAMSDSLTKVMRALSAERNVKFADEAEAFVTDPVILIRNYVGEVTAVAEQRAFLNASQSVGAIRNTMTDVNVDAMMHILGENWTDAQREMVQRFVENRRVQLQAQISAPSKPKKVNLGGDNSITIAAEVADAPSIKRAVEKMKRLVVAINDQRAGYERRMENAIQHNVNKGLSPERARQIATASIPELQTLRLEWEAAVEEAYDDLLHISQRAWQETSADGQYADEAIQAAREHVRYLKGKAKAQFVEVEDQYLRQIGADPDGFKTTEKIVPMEQVGPDDQVRYQTVMEAVLAPAREVTAKRREMIFDWLDEQILATQEARQALREEADNYTRRIGEGASPNQEYQARTLAAIKAHDDRINLLNVTQDAIATARAVDDDVVIAAQQAARKKAQADAAAFVADTWNEIVWAGLQRRHAKAIAEGKKFSAVARYVERIWFGGKDPATGEILPGFYKAAKEGGTSIEAGQLDSPWFWDIVADGIEDDWAEFAAMRNDPYFAGVDFDAEGATFISRKEIVDNLDRRIEKLQKAVDDLDAIHRKEYRGEDVVIPEGAEQTRKQLLYGSKEVATVDDPIAMPLLRLMDLLDEMKVKRVALSEGDEATTREFIIEHMAGRMSALEADAQYIANSVTRGMKVGDSVVATERAFRDLASAAIEPIPAERLVKAVDVVNRQLDSAPGTMRLRANADGTVTVLDTRQVREKVTNLKDVLEWVRTGQVTADQLDSRGLGFVVQLDDTRKALEVARKTAASMSGPTIATKRKLVRSQEAMDEFVDIVDKIVSGKATAERLRRWVFEGSRSGGPVSESKQFSDLLAVLPVDKQAQVRRLVDQIMASDPRVATQPKRLFASENEQAWNDALFRPLEETYHFVDQETARLRAAARAAEEEEAAAYYELAEDFLKKLSFVEEWRRAVSADGTLLDQYSRKLGPEGERTLLEAMGDLSAARRRLQTDGPFKYTETVPVEDAAAAKRSAASGQATTRKVRSSQKAYSRLPADDTVTLADGATVTIHAVDDNVAVFDADGNWLGGFMDGGRQFAVDETQRGRGVADALWDFGMDQQIDLPEGMFRSGGVTQDMVGFLERKGVEIPPNLREKAFGEPTFESTGQKVTIKAKERGFTDKQIARLEKEAKKAAKQAEQPLSREGMADPATFGLGGILEGKQIDPAVGQIYRNMVEAQKYLYTPEGIGELRSGLKAVLDWWRPAATIANPSFHTRNALSGVANGMLIGVNPRDYQRVLPQYNRFRQMYNRLGDTINGKEITLEDVFNAVDAEYRPMFRAAVEQEVLGTGFARGDVARQAVTGGASLAPWDRERFVLFRAGGKTMEVMEDGLRLAAFYKYFDPEYAEQSASFARQMVMMVHFDYKNISIMEQKFKRVAPFFIWTRRNVPLQVRALIERPGYAQAFHHFSTAMQDNLGSEEYRNSPLPSWYGSLAMPLGVGFREDGPDWARFVWDPDLPLGNLEDLPLFKRQKDSVLPFSSAALSPVEWLTWSTQLMGPQFSLPLGLSQKGEDGDYSTNAPAGLNEIGLLLENVDFFNMIDAEGSDWRWSGAQSDIFNTAVPFYKNFTGAFENNPGRAQRQGMGQDPGVIDRGVSEVMGLFGAGVGTKLQTPGAAGSASFEAQEFVREMREKSKVRAGDNPLAPGT